MKDASSEDLSLISDEESDMENNGQVVGKKETVTPVDSEIVREALKSMKGKGTVSMIMDWVLKNQAELLPRYGDKHKLRRAINGLQKRTLEIAPLNFCLVASLSSTQNQKLFDIDMYTLRGVNRKEWYLKEIFATKPSASFPPPQIKPCAVCGWKSCSLDLQISHFFFFL